MSISRTIDVKDRKILTLVPAAARTPHSLLARGPVMAASGTHERVKRLEAEGVIQRYETRVDPKALELNLLAFIFIKTAGGVGNWGSGQALTRIPEVQEVHCIAGEDCYLVKVRVASPEALQVLLREKFGAIESITHTNSCIVLSTLKETTQLPLCESEAQP